MGRLTFDTLGISPWTWMGKAFKGAVSSTGTLWKLPWGTAHTELANAAPLETYKLLCESGAVQASHYGQWQAHEPVLFNLFPPNANRGLSSHVVAQRDGKRRLKPNQIRWLHTYILHPPLFVSEFRITVPN